MPGAGTANHDVDVDVAIVGYGPVGQALAALLGRAGHRVAAFERFLRSTACRARSISTTRSCASSSRLAWPRRWPTISSL